MGNPRLDGGFQPLPVRSGLASADNAQGPAGPGARAGGTTGQVLKKVSVTDYDTEWAEESAGGGSAERVLLGTATASASSQINVDGTVAGRMTPAGSLYLLTCQELGLEDAELTVAAATTKDLGDLAG